MKSRRKKLTLTLTFLMLVGISFVFAPLCKAESIYDLTKAIERNPNDAGAYYRRGKAYYEADLKIRAIADFTMAIQLKPDFVDAYLGRARAYTFMSYSREKGRYDLAIADCAKAIELDPNNADAYEYRGYAYLQKDSYDLAIGNFTKAIELDPNYAHAYDLRSSAYDRAGDYVHAAVDYMKARKLSPDTPGLLRGVYGKHFRAWDQEKTAAAREYYTKIITGLTKLIQSNPDDALAYCARGMAYYERSRHHGQRKDLVNDGDRAIADYTKATELDPNYAYAYFFLGELFTIQSPPDDEISIVNYTKAIQLKPDFYSAYGGRARAYVRQKNYTLALVDHTILIQMSRNFNGQWLAYDAYDNRATVYALMGDYDLAIADYTKAMEFDSTRADICRHKRGWMYYKKGDHDRAIADFTKVIQSYAAKYSDAESYHYMARGEAYLAKSDYNRAIVDFTKAIERYGSDHIFLIHDPIMGPLSFSMLRKLRILDERRNPYERRGYAYLRKGDSDNAIADFTKVLKFYPQASNVYKLRGDAYLQKGDFDRSATDYAKATELKQRNKE